MPPLRILVSLMEGRVGLLSCLAGVSIAGFVAIVLSAHRLPLAGFIIAVVVESVCAASRGTARLVYMYPRLHERIVSLSPAVTIMCITVYYASSGHEVLAGFVTTALLLTYSSVTRDAETIVNILLLASVLLLELHSLLGDMSYLALSLFPILVATGYSIATLIYREAVGIA